MSTKPRSRKRRSAGPRDVPGLLAEGMKVLGGRGVSKRCFVAVNIYTGTIDAESAYPMARQSRDDVDERFKGGWRSAHWYGWRIRPARVVLEPRVTR